MKPRFKAWYRKKAYPNLAFETHVQVILRNGTITTGTVGQFIWVEGYTYHGYVIIAYRRLS